MRDALAERLLAAVMGWEPADVAEERPVLQAFANLKYDDYQQFSPGMRFIESLAVWLSQFDSQEERDRAYRFVRRRLHFISAPEMVHLVTIAYRDYVRRGLLDRLSGRDIKERASSVAFASAKRRTLFLGLSDGAHLDIFRRANPELSHEQIYQTYSVSAEKAADLKRKLRSDLAAIHGSDPDGESATFNTVVLLDDFTASGLSYIRRKKSGDFGGKISKVLLDVTAADSGLGHVVAPDARIFVLLYVATERALDRLQRQSKELARALGWKEDITVRAIQVLPAAIAVQQAEDDRFLELLKTHFDPGVIDEHYEVGRHDNPHLGFDECGLPVVLFHNTPNNAIPLLWFERHRSVKGLFPRVSRHGS